MRRLLLSLGLGIFLTTQAFAQYSGQFSTAITTPAGASRISGYAGIYDGALGIVGQYRYGISSDIDLGIKLGILDFDSPINDAGIDLAGDFKYRLLQKELRDPFDLSLGGAAELTTVSGLDIFSIGFNAIGSYNVKLHNGRMLVPYGKLNLRVQRESPDRGHSNTDFEIGLNLGTSFELSKSIRAFGEFQFDDPFAFYFGFDFDI